MKNYATVFGMVEQITYFNPTTGYSVLVVNCDDELITVVGNLGEFKIGEFIQAEGYLDVHPVFGDQFKVKQAKRSLPIKSEDILRYLSCGAIKGVGPSTAKKMIEKFGDNILTVIEETPDRLVEIKGISPSKAYNINEEYNKQHGIRDAVVFLSSYDISYNDSLKIFKILGEQTVEKVKNNPYILCKEDIGFSFERADEIAEKLGFEINFSSRIHTAIKYVLKHNLKNGHTCLPKKKHISVCSELLQLDEQLIEKTLDNMIYSQEIFLLYIDNDEYIMLSNYFIAESNISKRIKLMLNFPPNKLDNIENQIERIENSLGYRFEDKQTEAIKLSAEKGLLILTGGPGTGKTTTLNGIIKLFENNNINFALAAPTGRAAKRISEITGMQAKTIHRLLEVEWNENGKVHFCKNENNTLDVQAVIIDEFSMMDSILFDSLLRALPVGCRLILVGDSNQLPSIGAGNILQDLIESNAIPTIELTEIFRQSSKSDIIANAHKILNGEFLNIKNKDTDFYFLNNDDTEKVCDIVLNLVVDRIPNKFDYDCLKDIQILCPSRKRNVGTLSLNNKLQKLLNPKDSNKSELNFSSYTLRVGDKIIQTKNNYDVEWKKSNGEEGSGIFNGDLGVISAINYSSQNIIINFDDRIVEYPFEKSEDIELAYAMTVHKSQGSEFNCVVVPICDIPTPLMFRNILYTAVTRAKQLLIIVGDINQMNKMIENNKKTKRYTALKHLLVSNYEL